MSKRFTIYGSKQRGKLSHFTKDIYTLIDILRSCRLQPGDKLEYNPNTGKLGKYISFSRDLLAATNRSSKWKYGLIIDGDQLSENYNLTPYSYENINNKVINNRVKVLTSYEDGSYTVSFVGKNTTKISKSCYDYIKNLVVNYDRNENAKLIYQEGGKRKTNGTYIKEKFTYNNSQGGVQIPYSELPLELKPFIDEYEERFWETSKQHFINLNSKIVQGIILPRKIQKQFENSSDIDMETLRSLLDDMCGKDNYIVMYW